MKNELKLKNYDKAMLSGVKEILSILNAPKPVYNDGSNQNSYSNNKKDDERFTQIIFGIFAAIFGWTIFNNF